MPPKLATLSSLKAKKDEDTLYAGGAGEHGGSGVALTNDLASKASRGPAPEGSTTITLYRNGFIIGEGEFRDLKEPANEEFVKMLMAGDVPEELRRFAKPNGEVPIALNDKRGEDYEPPPPPSYIAFSGDGMSLGSSAPALAGAVVTGAGAGSGASYEVDESKPKTTVQIRLHDGRRVVGTFNKDHPVAALQNFVSGETPGVAFTLVAGFPPKPLSDPSVSLAAAGVAGAAVTQKLC